MSLTESNLLEVAKKQYYYKLRAYMSLFFNLIGLQIVALLISTASTGGISIRGGDISFSVRYFSNDLIIAFTMAWVFVTAISFTTKAYRNMDFAFVSNRISSNLSNIAFILTTSIVGGITSILAGFPLRLIAYFSNSSESIGSQNFFIELPELLLSMLVTILYLILIGALGYFVGMLVQKHKSFTFLLPALIFGTIFIETRIEGQPATLINVVNFFANESILLLFIAKITAIVTVLLYGVVLMSNRMEVRK